MLVDSRSLEAVHERIESSTLELSASRDEIRSLKASLELCNCGPCSGSSVVPSAFRAGDLPMEDVRELRNMIFYLARRVDFCKRQYLQLEVL
jgi:hypothetical protein